MVIPAALRSKAGFRPGTELEVLLEDYSIRLVRAVSPPKRVRRGRRCIMRPTVKPDQEIDVAALVDEERDRWPL